MPTATYAHLLTADVVVDTGGKHPFSENSPIRLSSPGAAVIHGVNRAPKDSAYFAQFIADGATVAWDEDDNPNLANLTLQATLNAANFLEVVVLANGVVLTRVDDGATPSAGEFKIADSGGKKTLTVGSTYGAGTRIDVHIAKAVGTTLSNGDADPRAVVEETTLVAGQAEVASCYGFMRATVANAVAEAVPGTC